MNEEIMIDGVNVAECEFIADTNNNFVKCMTWVHNNQNKVSGHWDCRENKNCYFKQLKRLEKREKSLTEIADDLQKRNHNLTLTNEKLEQENKELKEEKGGMQIIIDNYIEHTTKYKEALEEIREICKCAKEPINCDKCPQNDNCEELCVNDENLQDIIQDKIKEVLDADSKHL